MKCVVRIEPRMGRGLFGTAAAAGRTTLLGLLALSLVSADDSGVSSTYYTCSLPDGRILMRETPCPPGAKTLSAREVVERPQPARASGSCRRLRVRPGRQKAPHLISCSGTRPSWTRRSMPGSSA